MTVHAGPYISGRIASEFALAKVMRRAANEYQIKANECRQEAAAAERRAIALREGTDWRADGEDDKR